MSTEAIVSAMAVAVAAGLVGCFAVIRRMSLAADALSHVALPGIGIAIALGIDPLIGAVAMLAFGALTVWALEDRTRAALEGIIGVVFSSALAVGSLLTKGDSLIDALFGQPAPPSRVDAICAVVGASLVVLFLLRSRHRLIVALISPDLARTTGVDVRRLNFWFLQVFALTIALGLRYLGVLLMGSLVIIPAVTAKRWARAFPQMLVVAAGLAAAAMAGGIALSAWIGRPDPAPIVVLVATALFLAGSAGRRVKVRT